MAKQRNDVPTAVSGVIPGHPKKFTYEQLDHWLQQRGWTLSQYAATLMGGTPVERNKAALLAMPIGTLRRDIVSHLRQSLGSYTTKTHGSYDSIFDAKIRKQQPDWFFSERKNRALLALLSTTLRPSARTDLGLSMRIYMSKSHASYDSSFDTQVREKHPHWFVSQSTINKNELLNLPNSTVRPTPNTRLGSALRHYTVSGGCYDPVFDKRIRKRFPHWFITRSDIAVQKKHQLLNMSSRNLRPSSRNHKLGRALCSYTTKSQATYDPVFDKKIRKRFPHWFRKKAIK